MADKIITDTKNQRLYLENLVKSGDAGQQAWANEQLANFDNYYSDAKQTQPNTSMNDMMNMLGAMSGAYIQQQQGMLEASRQNQLTNLQKAYSDAVAQGKMSIRDAEEQYMQQADAINQAAYQDAERTKLYGQNMGLQNSQQMIGLMQGDNARKNSLINQNMTVRDKRINDIRDRINSITTQRDLDVANVNAQYDAGMQQAMGTAMLNMYNNKFGLLQNDYMANREHQRTLELSDIEYKRAKEMMSLEQRFALEQMEKEHGYAVAKAELSAALEYENAKKLMSNEQRFALERMEKEEGYAVARAKLSAELDAKARELQNEKELEMLYRAYGINPSDPNAPQKLRLKQNAEPAITESELGIALTPSPGLPEKVSDFERFTNFLNPFSDSEYVRYTDGNVYNKSELKESLALMDAINRNKKKYGLE